MFLSQWDNLDNFQDIQILLPKENESGPFALIPTIQRFLPNGTKLKIVINLFRLNGQESLDYLDTDFVDGKDRLLSFLSDNGCPFPYNQDLLQDVFNQDEVNAYFWNHPLSFGVKSTTLLSKIAVFYADYLLNKSMMLCFSSKPPVDGACGRANVSNPKNSVNLKTFAVGQTNFSGLFYGHSENPKCVFDLGCKDSQNINIKRFQSIGSKGYVVISHFDSDHINGFKYLRPKAFQRKFILPNLPNVPFSVTLIDFLNEIVTKTSFNPNICIIPNGAYQKKPYKLTIQGSPASVIKIYTGLVQRGKHPADPYQSTKENARG